MARGERGPFDPMLVSPSRVEKYLSCGIAFRRDYIDGEPAERSGSAALFGSVVHLALEKWSVNRKQDLVTLMAQAWMEVTEGTAVSDFIREYQHLSIDVMKAEKRARDAWETKNPGKQSKAPRMTANFKASPEAKKLDVLLEKRIPILNERSHWKFSDRDPLPSLYDESLILAKRYAYDYRLLPDALQRSSASWLSGAAST